MSAPAVVASMPPIPPAPPAALSRPRLTAAERLRATAIAPLWLVCAAGWGLTSAPLLTWRAVREMAWLQR